MVSAPAALKSILEPESPAAGQTLPAPFGCDYPSLQEVPSTTLREATHGRHSSDPGSAIATALKPPLQIW